MQNSSDTQSAGRDNKLITDKIFSKLNLENCENKKLEILELYQLDISRAS